MFMKMRSTKQTSRIKEEVESLPSSLLTFDLGLRLPDSVRQCIPQDAPVATGLSGPADDLYQHPQREGGSDRETRTPPAVFPAIPNLVIVVRRQETLETEGFKAVASIVPE